MPAVVGLSRSACGLHAACVSQRLSVELACCSSTKCQRLLGRRRPSMAAAHNHAHSSIVDAHEVQRVARYRPGAVLPTAAADACHRGLRSPSSSPSSSPSPSPSPVLSSIAASACWL